MAKYILLYRGNATPMAQLSEAEVADVLSAWRAWSDKHSSHIQDINPFGERAAIDVGGGEQTPVALQGHTIVEAESLEAAKRFCEDHPFYDGAEPGSVIDVLEAMPMPY